MLDWLAVWGVGKATWSFSRPILEDLAKEAAKDASKSYVGQCFQNVYSVIHRDPLIKATGLALKELLELIESELIRADVDDAELPGWTDDVRQFVKHDDVSQTIASLFLQPDYHLDPKIFIAAWQEIDDVRTLPGSFSWQYVARRFTVKVAEIRQSSTELQETFASLAKVQDSTALKELAGLPPDFNLETYREALVERYGNLDFASLETTGAYYNDVRLWSVFVPQSVRECHEYDPQMLEVPKEHLERLAEAGELDADQLTESEKLHEERRRAYVNQPSRPVLEMVDEPTALAAGVARATSSGTRPTLARSAHRLVVLGDPGSGKSSLLRFLALRWARLDDAKLRYTQPLPLLIELRDYNRWECPSDKSFPKYLHEASTWHRLNQQTLKTLLEQPDRVVLLLDGLDEVFDPADRERVVNDIHRFSNDYKHVRIVVTSRVVGYQPHRLRSADFRHFMLQDLDADQIGIFLDKWHDVTFDKPQEAEPKRQRLDAAIKNSKSIAQLAGNPLLLTMMAILNRNQKLPDDRVDLYQQCSRLLLHQWDVERTLGEFPGLSTEIGLREKTDILRTVAYAMQTGLGRDSSGATAGLSSSVDTEESAEDPENTAGQASSGTQREEVAERKATKSANYIDRQTLESLIEDYLHTELRFEQARNAARKLVEQLRTRNFILCYLGADSYAFVHRTFLEYFCAADIVHQFNVAKTLSERDLIALFDAHCRDDDWREVLRLICGQIDEQFVGKIVEHLATRTDLEKWDGKTPLPELPLAIWCLSEVRKLSNLTTPSDALYRSCVRYFEVFGHDSTTCRELVTAATEVREPWPNALSFSPTVTPNSQFSFQRDLEYWPQFFAAVSKNRSSTAEFISSGRAELRFGAIQALSNNWPDEKTREAVIESAVHDEDSEPRRAALQALAAKWPDETTRELLAQRAVQDPDEPARGTACSALGKMHSEFGHILSTKDLDGFGRYLDPLEPIPRDHIEKAAKEAGVRTEDIDAQVASLSAHFGWEITLGARPSNE